MLSSRKNLCLHPEVKGERDGKIVDSRCHALTAPHVREKHQTDSQVPICSLYETFDAGGRELLVPPGVYNLEDLRQYCDFILDSRKNHLSENFFFRPKFERVGENCSTNVC